MNIVTARVSYTKMGKVPDTIIRRDIANRLAKEMAYHLRNTDPDDTNDDEFGVTTLTQRLYYFTKDELRDFVQDIRLSERDPNYPSVII